MLSPAAERRNKLKADFCADYQDMLEKKWIEKLRSTYAVEIKEDVLETVNKNGK